MKRNVAAILGGMVGGALGYFGGFGVIGLVESDDVGLDGIVYWLIAGAVGLWIGSMTGIAMGLRIVQADVRGSALFWTVVAMLPLLGATSLLAVSFNDADDNMPLILEYALGISGFLAAIWFGAWMAGRHDREPTA